MDASEAPFARGVSHVRTQKYFSTQALAVDVRENFIQQCNYFLEELRALKSYANACQKIYHLSF